MDGDIHAEAVGGRSRPASRQRHCHGRVTHGRDADQAAGLLASHIARTAAPLVAESARDPVASSDRPTNKA